MTPCHSCSATAWQQYTQAIIAHVVHRWPQLDNLYKQLTLNNNIAVVAFVNTAIASVAAIAVVAVAVPVSTTTTIAI